MAAHTAQIEWRLPAGQSFADNRYSRAHAWRFDGGVVVPASSSPAVVPVPMSATDAVDPEEAFVASLASCHMLWFLALAAKRGFSISAYDDKATGTMGRNGDGRMAMLRVVLAPHCACAGDVLPTRADILALHDEAHHSCYIANSVTTEVTCAPVFD